MKKLFKVLILLILFISVPVNAYEVKTCDRNDMENYGVNKKWGINNNNLSNVLRTHCVDASVKVYDFSDVLSKAEEDALKRRINSFIQKYNTDVVIVIDNLPYTYDKMNEEYAADFYDYNDFGINYSLYDGILLFRNTYEADRYYDIYTFGNAQLYFDNYRYDELLDGIYPYMKNQLYMDAFTKYLDYLDFYYFSGRPKESYDYYIDENGYAQKKNYSFVDSDTTRGFPYMPFAGISGAITFIIIAIMIGKNKMVKKALTANDYLVKSSINYTDKRDEFVSSHTTSWTESDHSYSGGSGGGGFHSSGGSSGGGHSSGGGRHG